MLTTKEKIERLKLGRRFSVVPVILFSFNDHPFRRPSLVVYFGGCLHRCEGCHSKVLWEPDNEFCEEVSIESLEMMVLDQLEKAVGLVNSLVLLGGDPVEYYPLLADFLEDLRRVKGGLEVVLYTGYLFEGIPDRLKDLVDVIVDGRYMEEFRTGRFPASSNQRVWVKVKVEGKDGVFLWQDLTKEFLR